MHVNHARPEVTATPQTPSTGVSHLVHQELTTTRSEIAQQKHALNAPKELSIQKRGEIALRTAPRVRLEALLTRKAKQNVNFVGKVAFNSTNLEHCVRCASQGVTLTEKDQQIAKNVHTV